MDGRGKWILAVAGGLVVAYSIFVLGYVATSPDLRLRCLIVDDLIDPADQQVPRGVQIRDTPNIVFRAKAILGLETDAVVEPVAGDILLRIREHRTLSFLDFARQLSRLRNAPIPPGGAQFYSDTDFSKVSDPLPSLIQIEDGPRWVEIEFYQISTARRIVGYAAVQSLPLLDVLRSFVWFLLQLGVVAIGALAYWSRPFDRGAQLFLTLAIVTLGAFIGGDHWWVVAGNFWLTVPYIVCAVLVPAVMLHLFLIFPRPKSFYSSRTIPVIVALYALPALIGVGIVSMLVYCGWLRDPTAPAHNIDQLLEVLTLLRLSIYAFFAAGIVYFGLTLAAVLDSDRASRNPLERSQLKWIWRSALIAVLLIASSALVAVTNRTSFALGVGRIPLFLGSLVFMLAYTVGLIRYKLMLVDQIVSKGMLYYVVSNGLTIAMSVSIALCALLPHTLNMSLSSQQALSAAAVLMLSVFLLMWARDLAQQTIDRQFFREKYQLDKALKQMNRAARQIADPEVLSDMMLGSCRDVLGVDRAALYLHNPDSQSYQLVSGQGMPNVALEFPAAGVLAEALEEGGSLQRVTSGSRSEMSPVQELLSEWKADLVHPLEVDQEIAGLVVLGEKKNGTPFTAEDLTFLNALGQITNVALHSAHIDQELTRLNEQLRLKVDTISDQNRQLTMLQTELAGTQLDADTPPQSHDAHEFRRGAITGNSPAIRQVLATARKVADSQSSVLIRGESGTGKELLAQVLHDNSPRHNGPLISVHCASLAPTLLESELFGHVKGAFTGAHRDRIGRFEMAAGGTLFLDEIGDISLETQVKLLRVLQERSFEPVGGSRTVNVDVRLVTATHQNLEKLIATGQFREDLYYRLNVIRITLPPLRERTDDIVDLALHFLKHAAQRLGKHITHLDPDVLATLKRYRWPGNIRELENVIERAVVLADNGQISINDLPEELTSPASLPMATHTPTAGTFQSQQITATATTPANHPTNQPRPQGNHPAEREMLEHALKQCTGNKTKAARLLGMPRSTYYSKLKKYAIE